MLPDTGCKNLKQYYNQFVKPKQRSVRAMSLCLKYIPPVSSNILFSCDRAVRCIDAILYDTGGHMGGKLIIIFNNSSVYLERKNGKIFSEDK